MGHPRHHHRHRLDWNRLQCLHRTPLPPFPPLLPNRHHLPNEDLSSFFRYFNFTVWSHGHFCCRFSFLQYHCRWNYISYRKNLDFSKYFSLHHPYHCYHFHDNSANQKPKNYRVRQTNDGMAFSLLVEFFIHLRVSGWGLLAKNFTLKNHFLLNCQFINFFCYYGGLVEALAFADRWNCWSSVRFVHLIKFSFFLLSCFLVLRSPTYSILRWWTSLTWGNWRFFSCLKK